MSRATEATPKGRTRSRRLEYASSTAPAQWLTDGWTRPRNGVLAWFEQPALAPSSNQICDGFNLLRNRAMVPTCVTIWWSGDPTFRSHGFRHGTGRADRNTKRMLSEVTSDVIVACGLLGVSALVSIGALSAMLPPRKDDKPELDIDAAVRDAPYHLLEEVGIKVAPSSETR